MTGNPLGLQPGDYVTGDQARADLPDGTVLDHVYAHNGIPTGTVRVLGKPLTASWDRGVAGHAFYRITSLPGTPPPRSISAVDMFSTVGPDRAAARAMVAQATDGHHPLTRSQVLHLLRIGYAAGLATTGTTTGTTRPAPAPDPASSSWLRRITTWLSGLGWRAS